MSCSTWASPELAQVIPWGCHPQSMVLVLQTNGPACSSILPCLEWICQPACLALYQAFIFLSNHWFIYPWFNCQGMRSAASLDDDIELLCSALSLCAVWNVTSSWFYLGDIAWTPCLCCSWDEQAGCSLPLSLSCTHMCTLGSPTPLAHAFFVWR